MVPFDLRIFDVLRGPPFLDAESGVPIEGGVRIVWIDQANPFKTHQPQWGIFPSDLVPFIGVAGAWIGRIPAAE